MAAGALDALLDLVKSTQDIAVVGYDNSVASYTRPKLTTMDLSKEQMVEEAVDHYLRIAARSLRSDMNGSCPNW